MGGKTGTTKSSVSIPPEVLARYNAVNAYAGDVAKTPFQAYQGQFVAGLTPTQQAGIQATSQYSQAAQPYYQAATGQLMQAQQSAMPGISAAYQNVGGAQDIGSQYAQAATQNITGAQEQAMPYYGMASQGLGAAMQYGQPYLGGATTAAMAGAQGINPEALNIGAYMSPYTQAVADTTYQALRQQQQQEMAGQTANAIRSGAFGGDRSGLVAANLARQQQLGTAQAMAPIYQQGYGQALAAAQQQQGVGLSAAQANRAALQNLAQQLQGIGQQGYAQQLGGAQFAQQLGQGLYGMGTGTGQALAGLGQQQYGQGMGAAQQLAGLAQQGYGMGAATSQALAGLGQGAQQSALQGAQAQLGAGTLEQQTQQADLTAQYQQFLQERGYPFQVAQFLANIAMGTGALSGQTTTTTQPMPFFSDRRVKHDVKEIGETHDGQPIYSFKYNGDNATQIGLMAQDVEKHHPEAVYDMGGVKGVDYKQATQDAERKERYEGGLVPASMGGAVTEPGAYGRGGYYDGGSVDPNDIQALLAQQQTAFGPFSESGLYGGSHHDAPFSAGKGVVPTSRLYVPRMMQPTRAPELPDSTAKQALSAFDTAVGMKDRYEQAKKFIRGDEKTPSSDQSSSASTAGDLGKSIPTSSIPNKKDESWIDWLGEKTGFWADGGVVPREHHESGGVTGFSDPYRKYKGDEGQVPEELLDIENKLDTKKPTSAASSPTSQTGLSIGDAVSLGKFILPFFLKDGGIVPRGGYEDGGSPDLDKYLNAIAKIESSGNYDALGPRTKTGDRAYGKYQVMGANIPSWTEEATGKRMTPDEFLANKEAQETTARHHFGKALNQYGTPEDAASVWFSGRPMNKAGNSSDITGTTVPEYINRFRSALGESDLPARRAVTAQGVSPRGSQTSQGIMPGVQNWLAENQGWLSPLGAGLKGMVQSRSPFLAGALLEGAGAGLEAVTPAQKALADIAQTQASTGLTQVQALREGLIPTQFGNFIYARNKQTGEVELLTAMDYNRNKSNYEMVTGIKQQPTQNQILQAVEKEKQSGGTPVEPITAPEQKPAGEENFVTVAPPGTRYDAKSKSAAKAAPQVVSDAQMGGGPQALIPVQQGQKYIDDVEAGARAARSGQTFVNEYVRNLAKATTLKGFEAPGFMFDNRAGVVNVLDTLLRGLGVADGIGASNDVEAINRKIESLRGNLMATQSGQESYHALKMLAEANANPNMAPDAYAPLAAMLMVQERRNIDRANHARQWGADSGQVYYGADQDFERNYNTGEMMRQVDELSNLIKNAPKSFQDMISGRYNRDEINAYFEKRGLKNMARYFVGEAG